MREKNVDMQILYSFFFGGGGDGLTVQKVTHFLLLLSCFIPVLVQLTAIL